MADIIQRPRRLRKNQWLRALVQENRLTVEHLAQPVFLMDGRDKKEAIASMPGVFRYTCDEAIKAIAEWKHWGVRVFLLFPVVPEKQKDALGSWSSKKNFFYLNAISAIKQAHPDVLVVTDVALDPYTPHGHDGLLGDNGEILNDETLPLLGNMAVEQARSGADIIAPSDMMDGRVGYIRQSLDKNGFTSVSILSYAAKYASSLYGPFRDCLQSNLSSGDKKTYQMNPANIKEAIREANLDCMEGADIIMVKPGIPYLDVIRALRDNFQIPVAAYHVSGEYSSLKAASQLGWLDFEAVLMEHLIAFVRAGASMIVTYASLQAAKILDNNS